MYSASFPAFRVLSSSSEDWGLEAVPFQPLEHNLDSNDGGDDDKRSSYFISKGSGKGNSLLEITRGGIKNLDYNNLDLIVGLHIQNSGYVFLESLHPTQEVYFARDSSHRFIKEQKRLLPRSKPPNERMLVLLDFDAHIFINDEVIEFKIGSLDSITQKSDSRNLVKSVGMRGDVTMGQDERGEDPHILVQQSYPQDSLRRGDTDLAYLTPVVPGAIQEEPKVHETPSVKSRFMDPDSATVTLPKILAKEDTFNDLSDGDEPTPSRNNSTAKPFVASVSSDGLTFGGHDIGGPSEETASELSAMGDAVMSVSDEEETGHSSKFFGPAPIEANSIESTADEEVLVSTRKITLVTDMVVSPIKIVSSPEETDGENKNHEPEAEDMRKQFSEVTSHVGSPGVSKRVSSVVGRAGKDLDTPVKHMKQGVPEGFLYEEHKKETTPKQTYGKNKRASRSGPREKVEVKKITESAIGTHGGSTEARDKRKMKVRGAQSASDTGRSEKGEEEAKGEDISLRQNKRIVHAGEGEDTITKITEDEEEQITSPRKNQGKGGRKAMQNQPSSTVARSTRKRRRAPEDTEDGEQPSGRETEPYSTPAGTKELTIAEEPKLKRAKTTPPKKPAARTPATKKGKRKDVIMSSLPESSEEVLGDTQYTFTDTTQTQATDRVEVRAPVKTPKTTPKVAERKTALSAKQVRTSAKKKVDFRREQIDKEGEQEDQNESEEIGGRKTRTRDQYEGDSPKIVFSNSGLDERKDIEKFLRANGGKKMHNISAPGVNFLVVGPGELKRTPKLTIGVALGKWVVEDQWLIDSKETGYFLDPDQYIPHDPTHEKAWSFSLRTAIARGRKGENNVLKDHNIYITPSLLTQLKASKQEESLVEMLKAAGAGSIIKKAPKAKKEDCENGDKTLILGTEKGDSDTSTIEKLGWSVYGTGIVAVSVLRGQLGLGGDEFRILAEKEGSQKAGRTKKGK